MPIDNEALLLWVNESVRPLADLLAGVLAEPEVQIAAAMGKGFAEILGTDNETWFRAQPWTNEMYGAIPEEPIVGSDSSGRTLLTNRDVIAVMRALANLKGLIDSNPNFRPLVGKVAVNPRPGV